jgi:hypothetical protein
LKGGRKGDGFCLSLTASDQNRGSRICPRIIGMTIISRISEHQNRGVNETRKHHTARLSGTTPRLELLNVNNPYSKPDHASHPLSVKEWPESAWSVSHSPPSSLKVRHMVATRFLTRDVPAFTPFRDLQDYSSRSGFPPHSFCSVDEEIRPCP